MTTTMKSVLAALSALMVGVGFADTITWTGEGLDHLWSTKENWDKGRIPANGDSVKILAPLDSVAITNDIGGLSLEYIQLSSDADNQRILTLVGEPITLTSALYAIYGLGTAVVTNAVEMTATSCQYMRFNNVVMLAPLHIQSEKVEFYASPADLEKGCYFYGAVDAPNTTLTASSAYLHFYGPVDAKCIASAGSTSVMIGFYNSVGRSGAIEGNQYLSLYGYAENALPTNAVIGYAAYLSAQSTHVILNANQTVNRVTSPTSYTKTGEIQAKRYNLTGYSSAVLTLRGTADAWASVALASSLQIVWDPVGDFTQTFADQTCDTTGSLTVRRGTLESSGANTFKNVKSLTVARGATFKVSASEKSAATNPFSASTIATIGAGGAIEVAEGVTVTFKSVMAEGLPMPVGTYQAENGTDANATKVAWVRGAGLVSVAQVSGTGWKAAVSGNFSDAGKWSNGLPSNTNKGYVSLETDTPYVVTLDGNAVLPSKLTVGGNVTLSVPTGVRQTFDGSSVTAAYEIKDGATVKVDGGELVFTNYHGTFTISGTGVETGRLAVAGGLFRYAPRKNPSNWYINRLQLMTGGAVDVTGGTFSIVVPEQGSIQDLNRNDLPIFRQQGGTFSLTGTGVYDQASPVNPLPAFGTGLSLLAGHSVITNRKEMDVRPDAAGETAELIVKSSANVTGAAQLRVGGRAGGTSKVLFDDDLVFGPPTAQTSDNGTATCIQIGNGEGTTLFEHRSGCIKPGQMGITIGGSTQFAETTTGCDALYRVTGGALDVLGKDSDGWGQLYGPMGLAVGCGYCTKNTTGRPYHGVLSIEAGGVTNNNGYTTIGGGMGCGEVVQTGGSFNAKWAYMAVGYGHGVGRYVISNGTATVGCPLYIGGCRLDRCGYSDKFTATRCPWLDLRDAEGTLSVAGGTFTVSSKATTLGEDGVGTIEMDGSKGQLTLKDLVLTHTAANSDSCGTLRFKLDADGVSPIQATSVTFDEKAKIEVDLGDYTGRSLKLVESVSVTGFDPDMVTITGARVKDATVKVTPAGLRLNLAQGMMILLR